MLMRSRRPFVLKKGLSRITAPRYPNQEIPFASADALIRPEEAEIVPPPHGWGHWSEAENLGGRTRTPRRRRHSDTAVPASAKVRPNDEIAPFYFKASPHPGERYPRVGTVIRPEEAEKLPPPCAWADWSEAEIIWEANSNDAA